MIWGRCFGIPMYYLSDKSRWRVHWTLKKICSLSCENFHPWGPEKGLQSICMTDKWVLREEVFVHALTVIIPISSPIGSNDPVCGELEKHHTALQFNFSSKILFSNALIQLLPLVDWFDWAASFRAPDGSRTKRCKKLILLQKIRLVHTTEARVESVLLRRSEPHTLSLMEASSSRRTHRRFSPKCSQILTHWWQKSTLHSVEVALSEFMLFVFTGGTSQPWWVLTYNRSLCNEKGGWWIWTPAHNYSSSNTHSANACRSVCVSLCPAFALLGVISTHRKAWLLHHLWMAQCQGWFQCWYQPVNRIH